MAIQSPHSSDWLFVLPVSACGLRLSDEAIRNAVGLRLVSICVNPTSARAELTLMRADCTVFPANAPAGPQGISRSMTLFGEHSNELTFLLPGSLPVLFEGMESGQMASHWCHGKLGAASHGTLRSLIHWPSHAFKLAQLRRPVQLIKQLHVNTPSIYHFGHTHLRTCSG